MTYDLRNAELAVLAMFREALQSWRWVDENQPGSARIKPLFERLPDCAAYENFKRTESGAYLAEVAEALEEGMNDDWMPDHLFGLRLSQAKTFLQSLADALEQGDFAPAIPSIRDRYSELRRES